ncbi:unnamed protein product [Paramecium pentaurelia]|uniref:Uncharacterized protein n=1 Tax=Paramecium pentaurelia TaxID=43138 RepID=A0A8S1TLP7_9CILI|nr:unnamed protein product [Paramecium pentaurelia]
MNSESSSSARPKKYDKISDDERCLIMELKSQGVSCQEIARQLDKNLKTIQSVQDYEKKSEYRDFKEAVTQYGIDCLLQNTSIKSMNEKKLRKLVIKTVKQVIPPKNTSMFGHLIPANKKDSNKRRIIDQIVDNILDIIQKYLKSGELPNLSYNRFSSKSDPMYQEYSNQSYSTNNIIQEDSQALHSHQIYDDCNHEFLTYDYIDNDVAEMIVEFENSSLNFSNNDRFEKYIEEFSSSYFSH